MSCQAHQLLKRLSSGLCLIRENVPLCDCRRVISISSNKGLQFFIIEQGLQYTVYPNMLLVFNWNWMENCREDQNLLNLSFSNVCRNYVSIKKKKHFSNFAVFFILCYKKMWHLLACSPLNDRIRGINLVLNMNYFIEWSCSVLLIFSHCCQGREKSILKKKNQWLLCSLWGCCWLAAHGKSARSMLLWHSRFESVQIIWISPTILNFAAYFNLPLHRTFNTWKGIRKCYNLNKSPLYTVNISSGTFINIQLF